MMNAAIALTHQALAVQLEGSFPQGTMDSFWQNVKQIALHVHYFDLRANKVILTLLPFQVF